MLNPEIALDPGTSGLRIYIDGKGVVVNEPSSIAVDVRDEAVLASGREARQLVDRAARVVEVRDVFSWGKVQNFPMASYLLNKHIRKIASGRISLPAAYISAPDDMTSVERQAFVEIMEDNGIHKVYFWMRDAVRRLVRGEISSRMTPFLFSIWERAAQAVPSAEREFLRLAHRSISEVRTWMRRSSAWF